MRLSNLEPIIPGDGSKQPSDALGQHGYGEKPNRIVPG